MDAVSLLRRYQPKHFSFMCLDGLPLRSHSHRSCGERADARPSLGPWARRPHVLWALYTWEKQQSAVLRPRIAQLAHSRRPAYCPCASRLGPLQRLHLSGSVMHLADCFWTFGLVDVIVEP